MSGLWGHLLKAKALAPINARRVLEGGWYLKALIAIDSLRKHPFLLALRRWGRFARRNETKRNARNVPTGEERGETDVFAGYAIDVFLIFPDPGSTWEVQQGVEWRIQRSLYLVIYSSFLDLTSHSHGSLPLGDKDEENMTILLFFSLSPEWQTACANVMANLTKWIGWGKGVGGFISPQDEILRC